MSWLWIYITMMEWVGIVMTVKALNQETGGFSTIKTVLYLGTYCIYSFVFNFFQLPPLWSITSYILLLVYICWSYSNSFIKNFCIMVLSLMIVSFLELILTQVLYILCPFVIPPGILEVMASTVLLLVCILLGKTKIYKVLSLFDKWEFSYALVAALSLMVFTPVVMIRLFKQLVVSEYIYISICVFVMWILISKIQKNKLENSIRKKYLNSFSEIITQIRRRQHKVKNQFNTAFSLYQLYDNYDELVEKQKEYLGRLWDYELPTDAIILEDPIIVALLYEKINEAIESGIEVETVFSCSMLNRNIADVIWVQILGTLLDNAIEALRDYEGSKRLWIEITEKSDGGEIFVCIANTCRKIKQSEMEKFFELGYSTKGEGRGVGLYDVKQLVYKNKGYLVVDNVKRDNFECFEIKIIL